MDRCTFCGSVLPMQAQFCGNCGHVNATMREMPTSISGFPDGNVLVDEAATVITRPPLFDPAVTAISKPSHPGLNSGEQDPLAVSNMPLQGPITPQASLVSAEEEDEEEEKRRRRALLLGIPLAAGLAELQPPGGVPMVQGMPQVGSVPMVQGNPGAPFSAPPMQGAGTPASSPFGPTLPGNTPPPHTFPPPHGSWPTPPGPTSGTGSSPSPSPTGSGSPGTSGGGSCALTSLIIVIIVLVILGTLGGLFFGLPPAISLDGNTTVTIGSGLHVQGSHFFPGSSITFTLDDSLQIFAPTHAAGEARNRDILQMNAAGLLSPVATGLKANAGGSFDITIPVSANWHVGRHTLRAREAISSRSAVLNFTVTEPAAKLVASPSTLDYGTLAVGSKTVLSVAVNNAGGKPLSWQANTGDTAWLSLSPTQGTIQPAASAQFIYVTADATQLSVGNYSATLAITSNDGARSQIAVKLQVVPQHQKQQAQLKVTPTSLDFGTLNTGNQLTKSITIANAGNLPLQWKADTGNASWVTLDTTSNTIQAGAHPATINVTVDTTNLSAGSQSATLTVNSNGGTQQVAITVNVNQPSTTQPCSLQSPSPSSLVFSANTGSNPADQTFTIAVAGNCANGVTITPTATTTTNVNWLGVSPASATLTSGSTTFTVQVASSSLGSGSYSGSISLDAVSGGSSISGSPQNLSVALTTSEVPPVLAVDTTSMSFNLSNGDNPASKSFHISNTGGSGLNWSIKLDAPSFVTVGSSSGNGLAAGKSVSDTVNVSPANVQANNYSATVLIYGVDPLTGNYVKGSPATITVSITITAQPSMQLSPTSLAFTPGNCVYTASSTVSLTNTGGGTLSWNVASPVYTDSGDPGGWLSVSPSGQGSGNTTLTFSVNGRLSNMIAGQTYSANVTVTPSAGNSQTVTVTFTVPYCIT